MFKFCLKISSFNLTKVEGCLKVLKIDSPTTKKAIKQRYLQLAKQLHPDVKSQNGTSPNVEQLQKRSEAFIEITKAYKLLNELSEAQINNPSTQSSQEYFGPNTGKEPNQDSKNQYERPMTPEEKARQATYSYFNKRNRRQSQQDEHRKKEPLYRQIPEFFLGLSLVVGFLLQWAYLAIKRTSANVRTDKKEDISQVLEGFSFKKKYERSIQ